MGHKTSQSPTKQLTPAAAERLRLNRIFTRLAIFGWAAFAVITFLAVTGLCDFAILNPRATTSADGTVSQNVHLSATVESACLMSSESVTPTSAIITNGTLKEDIGKSNLKIACNDRSGWGLYAVGYSTTTGFGDTNMNETTGQISPIQTGLATSGATSAWAMKVVGDTTGTYIPTIEYASNAYAVVPSTQTRIASYSSTTDQTEGSKLTTSYRVYIAPLQPAGTYVGKVKYTLLHPNVSTGGIVALRYM